MTAHRNIVLTGAPGVGKTTLVIAVATRLAPCRPVGFYTREIRLDGLRTGFEAIALDSRRTRLAHVDHASPHRVGRYGVDTPGFERFLASLHFVADPARPVILDEIGRMECFSARFRELAQVILDSQAPLLATVALRGSGLIAAVKARPDIQLIDVTIKNRNDLGSEIVTLMQSLFPPAV